MKRLLLCLMLLASAAWAQTTTITGTLKDLTGAVVTSGKVTFTLLPFGDTTISGQSRFSSTQVICLINGSGLIKAQDGTSVCTVATNTALNPPGSYYKVDVWPYNVKTSSFTFYAVLASYDWSTVVPTPATSPAQNFADVFSNQSIGGNKTFTGTTNFTGNITAAGSVVAGVENGVYFPATCGTSSPPSWCSGSDLGAWINAAYAQLPSGGGILALPAGSYSFTTPIVANVNHKTLYLIGAGNGATTLTYTPVTGTAITVDTGASQFSSRLAEFKLVGPGNGTATTGIAWGSVTNSGSTVAQASNVTVAAFGTGMNFSFLGAWGFSGYRVQVFDNNQNLVDTSAHENMRFVDSIFALNTPGVTGTVANSVQIAGSSDYFFTNTSFDNVQLACSANAACVVIGGHMENPAMGSYDFFVSSGMAMELMGVHILQDNASSFPNNRIGTASAGSFSFLGSRVFSPITLPTVLVVSGTVCAKNFGLLLDSTFSSGWVTGATSGCKDGFAMDSSGNSVLSGLVQAPTFRTNSTNPAQTGVVQLAAGDLIGWRNNANSGDLGLGKDGSDRFIYNSQIVSDGTHANTLTISSGTATSAGTLIAAGTSQSLAVTVTGAATTDVAICSTNAAYPATWQTGIQVLPPVATSNTVTLTISNPTAGGITPAAQTFRCTVHR